MVILYFPDFWLKGGRVGVLSRQLHAPSHHCATGKFDVATTLSGMPVGTPGLLSQTIER